MKEAKRFQDGMQAYFKDNANANAETEAVAKQGFKLEEYPGSERLVGRVKPTTVYEAPKPRRRPRV